MPFMTLVPLVLASASPRRLRLLGSAGLDFTVYASPAAEPDPLPGEDPAAYALRAARAKAQDIAPLFPEAAILAADTIVVLEKRILGKPKDRSEALAMLAALCGKAESASQEAGDSRTHAVITGCCLLLPPGPTGARNVRELTATSEVSMALQTPDAIAAYVATGEPMDKAGAYAIQGKGAFLVRGVRGSYTNVVGLPLCEVVEVLVSCGLIVSRTP